MDQYLMTDILKELESVVAAPNMRERKVRRSEFMSLAKSMKERYGYEHSAGSLTALEHWVHGYGLMMIGPIGVGKTSFFKALGNERIRFWSPLVNMSRRLEDIEREIDSLNGFELVVDDIGAEPTYNNFGVRLDIIPWIVEKRLDLPVRTHFTTNLAKDAIVKKYGARVADRLREMTVAVVLSGDSKRTHRIFN